MKKEPLKKTTFTMTGGGLLLLLVIVVIWAAAVGSVSVPISQSAKIVLANKTDLVEDQDVIDDFILNAEDGLEVIPISAKNDDSFEQVKQRIRELLDDLAAQQQAEEWKRSL